jgi:ABC-type lipoprotein export system ATPase subunit
MSKPLILCDNLVKIYKIDDIEVVALQGLDLVVEAGELMAIIGPSGSGKTSLLNVLGALDTPSAGRVQVAGVDLVAMDHKDRVLYRRNVAGFVWQNVARNVIPYLTAQENIMMPMILAGASNRAWARELLAMVGLSGRAHQRAHTLSGGEQQRVAVAMALANRPSVLLADEPTGSLDAENGLRLLQAFDTVRISLGVTVVIVTHDTSMARAVDRYVEIRDGKTSREAVRRAAEVPAQDPGDAGAAETHDHYTLLDSAGRLQLPADVRERYGIKGRVHLVEEENGIRIERPKE